MKKLFGTNIFCLENLDKENICENVQKFPRPKCQGHFNNNNNKVTEFMSTSRLGILLNPKGRLLRLTSSGNQNRKLEIFDDFDQN